MTYGEVFPQSSTEEQVPALPPLLNWNRCVERAAKIAEECHMYLESFGLPHYQEIRQKHGKFIAGKIRELGVTE